MSRSYYRNPDVIDNNFVRDDIDLQVNCTGYQTFSAPIHADSIRGDYYLFYLAVGYIRIVAPQVAQPILQPGDLIIIEKNTPYIYETWLEPITAHYWVHFTGRRADEMLRQCALKCNHVYSIGQPAYVAEKMQGLFSTFLHRDALFDLDSVQHLLSLLVMLGRAGMDTADAQLYHKQKRLAKSLIYIHEHYVHEISIAQLAAMEYISESRYRTAFHEVMHVSPHEYILVLRMNMAGDLLRQTSLSIAEIARTVGYADPRYFTRRFVHFFHQTPTEYRG